MSVSHLPSLTNAHNGQSSIPLAARAIARSPRLTRGSTPQEKDNSHALILKKMIGTTSSSSSSLAAHAPTRSIAFCAGAAVCVVHVDEKLKISHKYFLRARPNAGVNNPAQMSSPAQDARARTAASLREQGIGSPTLDSTEKGDNSKNWSSRERVKAATTVAFSPDGKFLAVGETGYLPRVLIYSMAQDGSSEKAPIGILSEHAFGVRSVAFSPCSRWLASIGTINDGFVYIWSMPTTRNGAVKLHSSNKCTSLVRDIAWMGKSLITVGLRHVKVWKVDEDVASPQVQRQSLQQFFEKLTISKTKIPTRGTTTGPAVLNGRNALLGVMSDNLFTSVVAIAHDKALVSTDKGEICLLDDSCQRFSKIMSAEFGVSCISVDHDKRFAWVAGRQGSIRTIAIGNIVSPPTPPESPASRAGSPVLPSGCKPADVVAMTSLGNHLITIDSNHTLKFIKLATVDTMLTPDSVVHEFAAHKNAVQGVKLMPPSASIKARFFTYSACGTIIFWDAEGTCQLEMNVEVEQPKESIDDFTNELKVVEVTQSGKSFVTGDKCGVLRVIDAKTRKCEYAVKAHSGEVMDLAVWDTEQATMVASCARDRTVQVFAKIKNKKDSSWGLTQTLEDHTASVSRVRFMEGGSKLLSCSVDRTIVIRDLALRFDSDGIVSVLAFLPVRTITLKSAAVHMTPCSDPGSALMVSTTGRQIFKFDISTGKELHGFKATDETGDSVVLDALTLGVENPADSRSRLLAGISTTDKSIRLYDTAGTFIDKEWGHTEGVSDLVMFEARNLDDENTTTTLVSTGTDGTVMMWKFEPKPAEESSNREAGALNTKDMTATQAPLRKVLSKADLIELSRGSPEKELASPDGSKPPENEAFKSRRQSRLETPQSRAAIAASISRSASPTKPHAGSTRSASPTKNNRPPSPTKPIRKRMSLTSMMKPNPSTPTPTLNIRPPSRPPSRTASPLLSPKSQSFANDVQTDTETSYNAGTGRRRTKIPGRERSDSPELKSSAPVKPVRRPSFVGGGSRPSSIVRPPLSREATDAVNANALAEQLGRTLKLFRRRIEGSQSALKPETKKDLENELNLTLKCIGAIKPGPSDSDSRMLTPAANGSPRTPETSRDFGRTEEAMLPLLNLFSERLLEMVESRMNSPASSPKKADIETFEQDSKSL